MKKETRLCASDHTRKIDVTSAYISGRAEKSRGGSRRHDTITPALPSKSSPLSKVKDAMFSGARLLLLGCCRALPISYSETYGQVCICGGENATRRVRRRRAFRALVIKRLFARHARGSARESLDLYRRNLKPQPPLPLAPPTTSISTRAAASSELQLAFNLAVASPLVSLFFQHSVRGSTLRAVQQ